MSDLSEKQPQPSKDSSADAAGAQPGAETGAIHPLLRLQRSVGNQAVARMIENRDAARPLDAPVQSEMSESLGADFSDVRVHTGAEAAAAASAMNARAVTAGNDIAFGADRYRPDSVSGRMLIAHELTHVAQQRRGGETSGAAAEQEAQGAAFEAVTGGRATVTQGASGLQASALSDEAVKTYAGDNKNKGLIFDLLRSRFPSTSTDADLKTWIDTTLSGDDLWLATKIYNLGPEPLWDDTSITERSTRAHDPQHPWDPEPGNIEATIGMSGGLVGTKTSVPIKAYFFPGQTDKRAMIIGGIHGSELSGVEVAERVAQDLTTQFAATKTMPVYTTIIVPQVFPDTVAQAKASPSKMPKDKADGTAVTDTDSNVGREIVVPNPDGGMMTGYPARQFPADGKHFADLKAAGGAVDSTGKRLHYERVKDRAEVAADKEEKVKAKAEGRKAKIKGTDTTHDVPLYPEIEALMKLIERFKPERIASVHGHRFNSLDRKEDAPGIFVDARHDPKEKVDARHAVGGTPPAGQSAQHTADDKLALDLATEADRLGARVPGNWLKDKAGPVVHYADSAGHAPGSSLGAWGPSVGITVVTVEVEHYYNSDQDPSGARAKELDAHAQALIGKFLQ